MAMRVRSLLPLVVLAGCAHAGPVAMPHPAAIPSVPPPPPVAPPRPAIPELTVRLQPAPGTDPIVHVAIRATARRSALAVWSLREGALDALSHMSARDKDGPLDVHAEAREGGVAFDVRRTGASGSDSSIGSVELDYDMSVRGAAPEDPLATVVDADRFRAMGERLLALPDGIEDDVIPLTVAVDPSAFRGGTAASSLGFGVERHAEARVRALRYAAFLAGALGEAILDAPQGHDEAAWIGSSAFDPRGAVSELAQLRTDLAQMLRADDLLPGLPETYLIEATPFRPARTFSLTPRFQSVFLQVGPDEHWSAPLQLAIAEVLARRWIGDAIRLVPGPEAAAGVRWFDDGVARYLATRLLSRAGFLEPDAWVAILNGELQSLATSPYAATGNADLGVLAERDPVARATLLVRGALYATRESVAVAARTRGAHSLEHPLVTMLSRARGLAAGARLPWSAWTDAVAEDDPDGAKTFDALVMRGGPILFPSGALGPCFEPKMADYVGFDPGFEVEATRAAKDARAAGVRAGGPAARAGLEDGDLVDSIRGADGDPRMPLEVEVVRGGKKTTISFLPTGRRGRAQTWIRVKGVPDERCGFYP
jgi:hypothetical protein